jgi:hypothetical protein
VNLVFGPQRRYLSLGLARVDGLPGGRDHRWLDKSLVVTELDDLAELHPLCRRHYVRLL